MLWGGLPSSGLAILTDFLKTHPKMFVALFATWRHLFHIFRCGTPQCTPKTQEAHALYQNKGQGRATSVKNLGVRAVLLEGAVLLIRSILSKVKYKYMSFMQMLCIL